MHWHSIITLLTWPVLILITYWLVMYALKKMESPEQKHGGKANDI